MPLAVAVNWIVDSVIGMLPVFVIVIGIAVVSKIEPRTATVGSVIEVQPTEAEVQGPR